MPIELVRRNDPRTRAYKFRLHFNRINMQRGDPRVWTVHTSQRCIPAKQVWCNVPLRSVFKPDGPQPRAYFEGSGHITVAGDTVLIGDIV